MYEIFIKHHFSSAHKLLDYKGECSRLHGHNWEVTVYARTRLLNDIGISLDFKEFKHKVREEIDKIDHAYLNEHDYFKGINPTAENIARITYQKLSNIINDENLKIHMVEVWESKNHGARYFE